MKKLLITLLAALLISGALAQNTPFPDIPANHWAEDAVARIADLGIIIGFPDGTFRGNEAFTRYQAALVISRTLDVLQSNIDAAKALSDADIASLRNAVQSLASDVAAQGVRLSAAESAVASISDDVSANASRLDDVEAAIEQIKAMMAAAGDTVDPAVVQDLQEQVASLRVGLDTAQAQAANAEDLANNALDAANAAAANARANAEAIDSLNAVISLLNEDVTGLDQRVRSLESAPAVEGVPPELLDDVARNKSDIANIREFVILLRRDQVALRDRVSALEDSDASQAASIADLDTRVTKLETNLFDISGSITFSYQVGRLSVGGTPFDVDRAYGANSQRGINSSASAFGTGDDDKNGDDSIDTGEKAQDVQDITTQDGQFNAALSVSFGFNPNFDGAGSPNALNNFSGVVNATLDDKNNDGEYGVVFNDAIVTADFVGNSYLSFVLGEQVSATFTPYVLGKSDVSGFVASVSIGGPLAFLGLSGTGVYTTEGADQYTRAAHLELNPVAGVTLGGSFAQSATNAGEKDDQANDNVTTTVLGGNGSVSLSVFTLGAEFATSSNFDAATSTTTDNGSVLFVTLDVDGSSLPILDSFHANYRDTKIGFLGIDSDTGDHPFELGQTGFGAEATLDLFGLLNVTGAFDQYTNDTAVNITGLSVAANADLFAGFSVNGFFEQANEGGAVVDATTGANDRAVSVGASLLDGSYETKFGAGIAHDGSASNALIPNLNLDASYTQSEADFSKTTIEANADYTLSVAVVTVTPYAGYKSVNDADAGTDDTTTIQVGTGLSTDPLNIFLMPSLDAAVNYRTTDHADADTYTATELQWSVGLTLNEFLLEHSSLAVRYGSWTGTNIQDSPDTGGFADGDTASDISAGDENNGLTQSTQGYEVVWNFYDLEFSYGVYLNTIGAVSRAAQAFAISYKIVF